MRKLLLFPAASAFVFVGTVAGSSLADSGQPGNLPEKARGLTCGRGENVLTGIFEAAPNEAASPDAEQALATLLDAAFPALVDDRDTFVRNDRAAARVDFELREDGARRMVVATREIAEGQWGIASVAVCSGTARGAR
ncbi:MAG TPA: hypothetical protein VF230_05810 [Acidimicrobiales bacterium]